MELYTASSVEAMGTLCVSRCLKNVSIHANFDWLLQSGDVTGAPMGYKRVLIENIISFFVFRKQFACHACESSVCMFEKRKKVSKKVSSLVLDHHLWPTSSSVDDGHRRGEWAIPPLVSHSSPVTLSSAESAHLTGCYR